MTQSRVASFLGFLACSAALAGAGQDPAAPAASVPADSKPAAAPAEARIPFANHHGIYAWHVVDDKTVLIEAQNRQWYKATLMTPCFDLPFANTVGFATNPDGSFDKFSAIKLRRQNCQLISLVKSDPPRKKAKKLPAAVGPLANE